MTLWLWAAPEQDPYTQRPAVGTLQLVTSPSEQSVESMLARGQHRSAAIEINRLHRKSIGRLAMAMLGSRAEADDSVQETLLQVVQSLSQFRGEGSVRAWVFGIARRVCAKKLEVQHRQRTRQHLAIDDRSDDSHANVLERHQESVRMRGFLAELKPTEREALLLRYEADLSYAEVAVACGVDENAARKRVSRALLRLRAQMTGGAE